MCVEPTVPDSPAASANGTVSPSDIPITMSRTVSPDVKCFSVCGVSGMHHNLQVRFDRGGGAGSSRVASERLVREYSLQRSCRKHVMTCCVTRSASDRGCSDESSPAPPFISSVGDSEESSHERDLTRDVALL